MAQRRKSLKPCKSYQYRDSGTNRCRNYKSPPKKRSTNRKSPRRVVRTPRRQDLAPCKPHQYRNPKTNRCKNLSPSPPTNKPSRPTRTPRHQNLAPCKPHQYRNPKTNRCKNLQVYQPLPQPIYIQQQPPAPPPPSLLHSKKIVPMGPGIPDQFKKLSQECYKKNQWKTNKLVGYGNYGSVYQVCKASNETDCNYVMKSQKVNEEFYQEINALQDLQSTGIVPKLYSVWVCGTEGFIVTELLKECTNISGENKYKQLKNALDKMKAKGWLHVDIHSGNIMCADDGKKVIMIDFGWAVKKGDKDENTLYSNHALVGQITDQNIPISWKQLEIVQNANLEFNFDQNGLYDEDAYLKASKEYLKLDNSITQSELTNILRKQKEAIDFNKKNGH